MLLRGSKYQIHFKSGVKKYFQILNYFLTFAGCFLLMSIFSSATLNMNHSYLFVTGFMCGLCFYQSAASSPLAPSLSSLVSSLSAQRRLSASASASLSFVSWLALAAVIVVVMAAAAARVVVIGLPHWTRPSLCLCSWTLFKCVAKCGLKC